MLDVRGLQGCIGSSVDSNTVNVPSQGGLFAGGMNSVLMSQQYGRVPPPPSWMSVQDVMQYASGMNWARGRRMRSPIPSPQQGAWTREGPKVVGEG